jgi:hypothetical protein
MRVIPGFDDFGSDRGTRPVLRFTRSLRYASEHAPVTVNQPHDEISIFVPSASSSLPQNSFTAY